MQLQSLFQHPHPSPFSLYIFQLSQLSQFLLAWHKRNKCVNYLNCRQYCYIILKLGHGGERKKTESNILQYVSFSILSSLFQVPLLYLHLYSILVVFYSIIFQLSLSQSQFVYSISIVQLDGSSWCLLPVCMICRLMCTCNSTLTCSLACTMGLLHDETNTRLSIEQPMDLKSKQRCW